MWQVIELCIFALIAIFIITQWILPPWFDQPFFWIFRKNTKRIEKEYDKLQDIEEELKIQKVRNDREKLLQKMVE